MVVNKKTNNYEYEQKIFTINGVRPPRVGEYTVGFGTECDD